MAGRIRRISTGLVSFGHPESPRGIAIAVIGAGDGGVIVMGDDEDARPVIGTRAPFTIGATIDLH